MFGNWVRFSRQCFLRVNLPQSESIVIIELLLLDRDVRSLGGPPLPGQYSLTNGGRCLTFRNVCEDVGTEGFSGQGRTGVTASLTFFVGHQA